MREVFCFSPENVVPFALEVYGNSNRNFWPHGKRHKQLNQTNAVESYNYAFLMSFHVLFLL